MDNKRDRDILLYQAGQTVKKAMGNEYYGKVQFNLKAGNNTVNINIEESVLLTETNR
jgi:hypothetical protein